MAPNNREYIPAIPGLLGMSAAALGLGAYSSRAAVKEANAASKLRRMSAQSRIAQGITKPQNFVGQGLQRSAQGLRAIGPGTPGNLPMIPQGSSIVPRLAGQNFEMLGSQAGNVFTGASRAASGVTPGMELVPFRGVAGRFPSYYGSSAPVVGGSGLPAGLQTSNLVTRYPGSAGASPLAVGDTVTMGTAAGRGGIPVAGALEAGTAAKAAAQQGLMARLGFGGANAAGTTGYQRFLSSSLTPGKFGGYAGAAAKRLGAYALPAQLASTYIVDPLNIGGANSAVDRFGTGALTGAGIGAGIGSILPTGITTAAGAGIGALVGGTANVIMGMFDDNSKADQNKKNQKRMSGLNSLMDTGGLTDNQRQQYMAQYNTQLEILRANGQDSPSNVAKLLDATEQQISKVAGTNAGKLTSKDMVALQAAIGQYMQPLIQQQQMSGDIAAQLYNQMANNMGDSAMANLVRGQAAGYKAQADRLSAAYMAQAQSIPALYGLQQTAQLANQQPSAQSADLTALLTAAQQ